MIVMTSNTAYEDETNPQHTIGPITGEQPGHAHMDNEMTTNDSSKEMNNDDNGGNEEKEQGKERKTGAWAAGTGRLFDPERWLRSDGTFDPNAGPSLPFSLGQRGCFGKSLAVSLFLFFDGKR